MHLETVYSTMAYILAIIFTQILPTEVFELMHINREWNFQSEGSEIHTRQHMVQTVL